MTKAVPIAADQTATGCRALASLARTGRPPENTYGRLARMQSSFGNQGMLRLISGGVLQRKLAVNEPGDLYEQEADRVADKVMRTTDLAAVSQRVTSEGAVVGLQRCSCGKSASTGGQCEECQAKAMKLQRTVVSSPEVSAVPPLVYDVLNSAGRPLDAPTRNFMESRFGHNFGNVRVHTDARAAKSAQVVNARAYTVGNSIVFNAGTYAPTSDAGQRILAHELTHVIQQGFAAPRSPHAFRGSVKAPTAEKPMMRTPAKLQRQSCDVGAAPGMACTDAQGAGHAPGMNLEHFVVNQSALLPAHTAAIDAFQRSWVAHGSHDAVQVHGYASCDGAANANVQVSCDRATTVSADLAGKGVANTTFAHGETNEFGAGLDANRRVIIQGVDLVAGRFVGNVQLEGVLHNQLLIRRGSPNAAAVRLIQASLIAQGYTLPGFGIDGKFGPETEATLRLFQTDVSVRVTGVVDPETMAALDFHDPTNLVGPGPVAKIDPLPGPRPAPAAGCNAPFAGVTFTLANQVAAGVANSVAISVAGGDLVMQGTTPANYRPRVTIHAPNDPKARQFRVGFISNMLSDTVLHTFSTGARIQSVMPTPIKDGAPLSSGHYDAIFVEALNPGIVQDFTANGNTANLRWPDAPSEQVSINLLSNAPCHPPLAPATLTNGLMIDTFRTWVAVRHMQTGCVKPLHHIDWNINWAATVNTVASVSTATPVSRALNVTEPNGNGSPAFIQGGPMANDLIATTRTCG